MTCHLFRSREQVRNPTEQVLHFLFDNEKERRGVARHRMVAGVLNRDDVGRTKTGDLVAQRR